MTFRSKFQLLQVVCLENQASCLYAEVIQIVEERQLCWVRPLALNTVLVNSVEGGLVLQNVAQESAELALYDLRQGADLLCPLALFRAALDTELVPILMALDSLKSKETDDQAISLERSQVARVQLQTFVHDLWKAHPEAFQS
jgi:hypothetical protein